MMINRTEILDYINALKGYEGYVQFSNTKIRECDIFKGYQDIKLEASDGFVYEAHFFNGSDSVGIKQLNGGFYVDESKDIPLSDTQVYKSKTGSVRMSQIWVEEDDNLCGGMLVKKLIKVVFAGFNKGESNDYSTI